MLLPTIKDATDRLRFPNLRRRAQNEDDVRITLRKSFLYILFVFFSSLLLLLSLIL